MTNATEEQIALFLSDRCSLVGEYNSVCLETTEEADNSCSSSSASVHDNECNLITTAMGDEVTAQLAAAGPVGVAAAAAVNSTKKQNLYSFEIDQSVRKRQYNRLLKKLKQIIDEFTRRVGKQAVVLVAGPGNVNTSLNVFGARPLNDVLNNLRSTIMDELENALAQQAPPPVIEDPSLFELPPLIIDGIPTSLDKMTLVQLRAFIPFMLRYSTGRFKPRWGQESMKPSWWPKELPWINVRNDTRTKVEKQKTPFSHLLRQVIINCYEYHGRKDLLSAFPEGNTSMAKNTNAAVPQMLNNPDGTLQVDPNNTLPIGTIVQIEGIATLSQDYETPLHTLSKVTNVVDLNAVTEATLNPRNEKENAIIVITVPSSASLCNSSICDQHLKDL